MNQVSPTDPAGTTSAASAPGLCVLCVDDEPQVLEGLRLQLHRHHRVLTAGSGAEALEILGGDQRVAVIVSDMRMPVMDGAAFLRRAREIMPEVPRILLTGQTEMASAIAAVNQGQIFGFLTKPCPPTTLIAAVTAAIGRYRLMAAQLLLMRQTRWDGDLPAQPDDAIAGMFDEAGELFGCRYTAMGLCCGPGGSPQILVRGLDRGLFAGVNGDCPVIEEVLRRREMLQLQSAGALAGLPAGHPEVTQLLGFPLATAANCHGWMYFADGRRSAGFGPEDLQAAAAIATACTNICEEAQARRLGRLQAEQLQAEKASRDHAETRAHSLLRAQTLMRSVISARKGMSGREELLAEICRLMVTMGGFQQAWVGLRDGDEPGPQLWHGADGHFAARMRAVLGGGAGPARLAVELREGRPLVNNDVSAGTALLDCRDLGRDYGFCSLAAIPFTVQGAYGGAFWVHAPEAGWFDAAEMALLSALAAEMSQTLDLIERDRQLKAFLKRGAAPPPAVGNAGGEGGKRAADEAVPAGRGCGNAD